MKLFLWPGFKDHDGPCLFPRLEEDELSKKRRDLGDGDGGGDRVT